MTIKGEKISFSIWALRHLVLVEKDTTENLVITS